MTDPHITTYEDIDWNLLWRNGRKRKSWESKGAADWDRKASDFAERNDHSAYIPLFLSRLPLTPSSTVLDVGCGPGTITLPLAVQVKQVTALDYSEKMLELLRRQAAEKGITNIASVHCSWESDWPSHGIDAADIAIASRSLNVADLSAAIDKLDAFARRYVFITDRIAPSPFDPEAFAAIGRPFNSGPDYIFTLNMLYAKGIHANVEILEIDRRMQFADMAEAVRAYSWMFRDITTEEMRRLEQYLETRVVTANQEGIVIERRHAPRWAMLWWRKHS